MCVTGKQTADQQKTDTEEKSNHERRPSGITAPGGIDQKTVDHADSIAGSGEDGWLACSASVPGRTHLRNGIPCQDAAHSDVSPRPFFVVADGRGSARHSDLGALSACGVVNELVQGDGTLLSAVLDEPDAERAEVLWPLLKDLLFRAIRVRQKSLAQERHIAQADLEHTLLVALVGSLRIATIHVGDGYMVDETGEGLKVLSAAERGEYANITCFVGARTKAEQVRDSLVPSGDIRGLAAMTDGSAERLIRSVTGAPSPGIAEMFQRMRERRFEQRTLTRFLTEPFWEPEIQDDRSLALLSRLGAGKCVSASCHEPPVPRDSGAKATASADMKTPGLIDNEVKR